jgi:hypothetical protein
VRPGRVHRAPMPWPHKNEILWAKLKLGAVNPTPWAKIFLFSFAF